MNKCIHAKIDSNKVTKFPERLSKINVIVIGNEYIGSSIHYIVTKNTLEITCLINCLLPGPLSVFIY